MGNASVGVSNVAGQRLSAAGKAERNVTRKRFATGERFDFAWLERFAFASGERFLIADRIEKQQIGLAWSVVFARRCRYHAAHHLSPRTGHRTSRRYQEWRPARFRHSRILASLRSIWSGEHVSSSPEALLFVPVRGGCHLNDRVFNENVFRKAAKNVGREDLSARDLRRFAGSKNAQVATLTENMARLGHKTVGAALRYQHSESGRDAIIATALSAKAIAERIDADDKGRLAQ